MKKLHTLFSLVSVLLFTDLQIFAQQWNGLTLYSTMGTTTVGLLDTNSTLVKTWNVTGGTGYSTHMIPGGTIIRTVNNPGNVLTGGGMTGRIQKVDYNGNILWDYTLSNSSECLHHDHCPLPNGNVLVICYEVKTQADLSVAGGTNTALTSIWSEKVLELKPIGTNSAQIVWEWHVWDHLVQNVNPSKNNYQTSIVNHPELLNINYSSQKDWMHMNGIDYNPILDQIIVSSHNLNEWYIIDHSTTSAEAASHSGGISGKGGDFLYRWGNPAAYQATGTKILNVTHDAHWIPEGVPGAGKIVGVNNKGVTSPSNKTTIDHVSTPRIDYNYTITPGSAFSPATYDSRHTSTGYTSNMGSSNQFPNGNQMICLATAGSIYEIDAAGNTLWTKSTGGICPQAHRYTQCYVDNAAPAQPSISLSNGELVSTAATTYQWYMNGNLISGATTQSYTPTQSGYFVVRITDVNGCVYAYSPTFVFGNPTNLNTYNSLTEVKVYPNPSNGNFKLDFPSNHEFKVSVRDMSGRLIMAEDNMHELDLSGHTNGVYFLTITSETLGTITKKITLIK